jgi:beta-glucosidase/6-phospho-beta-glucosidase/beta-galactosidase
MFKSFFMGGFECSTHTLPSGKRLDLIAATHHDRHVRADYARVQTLGMMTVRDGLRWHLIEQQCGRYDFSSVLPMIHAARDLGIQVIWDVCHYGYPDHLDIFSPAFVRHYQRLVRAFARLLRDETDDVQFICPVNEISFFAWAGGDSGHLNPYAEGRGFELKQQLVRAAIEGIETLWDVNMDTRIIHCDPLIHIVPNPANPHEHDEAIGYHNAQYQAWDMLTGRLCPELGGQPEYLDIMGVNYYPGNQWVYKGETVTREHPAYRPLRDLLRELYGRYQRPLFIAETSIEDDARVPWLQYIGAEVRAALAMQVPLHGLCWYPILNHPGWTNDRHCHNGLWDYCDNDGKRPLVTAFAYEWVRQQLLLHETFYSLIAT